MGMRESWVLHFNCLSDVLCLLLLCVASSRCRRLVCSVLLVEYCFVIILMGMRERAGCFTLIVFQMSCACYCSVSLPRGAVGWSAVCD